ncbi:hypothetical protein, partial [Nonomuraea sp. NPDC001023]|uniref:hypothetical protein n=1 Tax=Nonomuraea sp. NPDC001023 TaxID=3154770 RepID=UPI00332F842C
MSPRAVPALVADEHADVRGDVHDDRVGSDRDPPAGGGPAEVPDARLTGTEVLGGLDVRETVETPHLDAVGTLSDDLCHDGILSVPGG